MLRKSVLAFILSFSLVQSSPAYQLVEHPRIFITKSRLPELTARAQGNGMLAADYAMIKREADYFVQTKALKQPTSHWHPPYDMLSAALAYLVERELGNPNYNSYAEAIKTVWGNGIMLSLNGNGHFGNYAIIYDWIYDSMTAAERTKFGDFLGEWLLWYTDEASITLKNGGWLFNQTWGPEHLNTGNCRDGITPKLFVSLALHSAGTRHQAAADQFIKSWENRIPAEAITYFDTCGGVWPESMGHGSYGPTRVIPWAFEAWRTASNNNWFTLGKSDTYLKEMNRWAVHLTVPFNGRTAYIDDNSGYTLADAWEGTGPILGARYQDPVANYASTLYERGVWSDRWIALPWRRFIFYDTNIAPQTPGQAQWSTSRLFKGAGHVYMRSRWDDPNATWAFFGAGSSYAMHSRDDEGHFLIARKGWLVLRAGGQGHNDRDYYTGGSLAFNTVTVFHPTEVFARLTPGDSRLAEGGTMNERDGGMIRLVYSGSQSDIRPRANISAYRHSPSYTYAAADLSRSYWTGKAGEVTRQFLYLRGRREFFVIFDRIDATSPDYPKHWFLHIPSEPSVRGVETTITSGHVYSYTNADYATWLSAPAGYEQDVVSTGRSRAFLKTIKNR